MKAHVLAGNLDKYAEKTGKHVVYIPVDGSAEMVRAVAEQVHREHPDVEVRGVVGTFEKDVKNIRNSDEPLWVTFPGTTYGNFPDPVEFLKSLGQKTGDYMVVIRT